VIIRIEFKTALAYSNSSIQQNQTTDYFEELLEIRGSGLHSPMIALVIG
jgi:hypothetical protein